MRVQEESLFSLDELDWEQAKQLVDANWKETETPNIEGGHVNPRPNIDPQVFVRAEREGKFFAVLARDMMGTIVGYATNIVAVDMNNLAELAVYQHGLYLLPVYRKLGIGSRLREVSVESARKRNAFSYIISVQSHNSGLTRELSEDGFFHVENVMAKRLT